MLIILEGPDGAGKSTLTREIDTIIGQHAKVDVLHAGPLTTHPLDAYELPLVNYRPGTRHVICDRWHLGEMVYPAIFGRKTRWDAAVAQHIHMFLQARGALTVLLKPPNDELKTRIAARGDELIKPGHVDEIVENYERVPKQFIGKTYAGTDTATPSDIIKRARHRHLEAIKLNRFETYIGPSNPRVLILGDERAPAARKRQPGMGAFTPYANTSGHFLLRHLMQSAAYMDAVGIANACDTDDPAELWEVLGRPKVVTLGLRAHEKMERHGVPHGSAPHPQFVRRFYSKHGNSYVAQIGIAASGRKDLRSWRP